MFRRVLYCLLPGLCLALPLLAEDLRFATDAAIINAPYQAPQSRNISTRQLRRITGSSFASLSPEMLSDTAARVSVRGRAKRGRALSFSRFLKSRSPCSTAAVRRLLRVSKNLSCEPDWETKLTLSPNDSFYSSMYAAGSSSAGRMHLPEAWELTTGSANVAVGIIDTGIDYTHLDLLANLWTNPGEIAANSIDDDGNGYVDDVYGIDRINVDSDPFDDHSHGTHVAGTIGAVGNNARGVTGVAWDVTLISCKAFNAAGNGTTSAVVSCLNYLVNLKNNAGINIAATSNSYGGFPYTTSMYNAIAASRDAGMLFVAGAGNYTSNNDSTPFYPASFELDNIISVAAIDSTAALADFSNWGATSVDIAAPGVNVLSTIPGNQYAYYNGTSMATPHISGIAALLMTYYPEYSYSNLRSAILNSGTFIAGLAGTSVTGAIANAKAALDYALPTHTPDPTATSTAIPTQTANPTQTATPEEEPTIVPTSTPTTEGTDITTAKLSISVRNSRRSSLVTCTLSANDGSRLLPGYSVRLALQGVKTQKRATTRNNGRVGFTVRPPKHRSYKARCLASLNNPEASSMIKVKSHYVTLRLVRA